MNSHVHIWQSPFLKYFTSQQHIRWFRSRAASTVLINIFVLLVVASERQWKSFFWLFPSLTNYGSYHSQICLAVISLLGWNILNFGIRYLHCCYKLSRKFLVNSEEEKLDLTKHFHCSNLAAVRRVSSPSASLTSANKSPPSAARVTPPPSLMLSSTSSPRTPSLLDTMYLPSASPASARQQQQQQQLKQQLNRQLSGGVSQSALVSTPGLQSGKYIIGGSGGSAGQTRHVTSFNSCSSGASGDFSSYFSPPRNLSALSASLLLGGSGSNSQYHQQQQLEDFSYLSRLRYQLGTPSPSRQLNRSRTSAVVANTSYSTDENQQQQQQQQSQQQLSSDAATTLKSLSLSRLTPEQTTRALGIDLELACTPRGLDRWLQGIRAWLHGTLIEPLYHDIEIANARLREAGASPDMLLGQASLAQLQAACSNATSPWSKTLTPLLPYLQACDDQAYLVRRLSELASLPCLRAYHWDSGSPDRWLIDRHPSDARFVMSLLAAYLDRCLPPLPGNQRPFSSVFLVGSAAAVAAADSKDAMTSPVAAAASSGTVDSGSAGRPSTTTGSAGAATNLSTTTAASAVSAASAGVELRILSSCRQPPHYQLLLLSAQRQTEQQQQQLTCMDIVPGSRNMFYCLLFFFFYYYKQRAGRLRQVCLGESGLNLDWIFRGSRDGSGLDIEDLLVSPTAASRQ